jgi:hypothetical protein
MVKHGHMHLFEANRANALVVKSKVRFTELIFGTPEGDVSILMKTRDLTTLRDQLVTILKSTQPLDRMH